ncbi:hypothetical protein RI129_009020 [Pyrocoelia pectoralis]|uniref:UDP-glucuronosyltransferase n=1 Tax=Pyrocoelia pectoralis TaxID=417401 RepID=A0AAN7V9N7_9COLE
MNLIKPIPFFLIINLTGAAEILGVSPFPIFSQFQLGDRLYKELVKRGHNVTVITPYKEKIPIDNFKQILIEDIFERVSGSNDAHYGFCHHFKAPCVALMPMPSTNWFSDMMGNSAPPSYVPQLLLSYTSGMNFFQRTQNAVAYYFSDAPHLDNLYYNLSLILFNGHISVGDAVPLLPNTIDIAGYHINPPQKLPNDLQQYLDDGSEGNCYKQCVSKLKQRVIWKWEDDHLPDKPSNVLIRSWLPQQHILAHPNVVLFITHGGVSSTIEAVYHGKPILGLPVFSDQSLNMAKAEEAGYGRFIMFEDLCEERFREELHEVLRNPM